MQVLTISITGQSGSARLLCWQLIGAVAPKAGTDYKRDFLRAMIEACAAQTHPRLRSLHSRSRAYLRRTSATTMWTSNIIRSATGNARTGTPDLGALEQPQNKPRSASSRNRNTRRRASHRVASAAAAAATALSLLCARPFGIVAPCVQACDEEAARLEALIAAFKDDSGDPRPRVTVSCHCLVHVSHVSTCHCLVSLPCPRVTVKTRKKDEAKGDLGAMLLMVVQAGWKQAVEVRKS